MTDLRSIQWQVLAENKETQQAIYRRHISWDEAIRIANNKQNRLEFLRPEPSHRPRSDRWAF